MPRIFFPTGSTTAAAQQLSKALASYLSALEVHTTTKWFYATSAEPLGITPGQQADALIARVFDYLKETIGVDGLNASGATYEKQPIRSMTVWSSSSGQLATRFSLVNLEGDLYAFVSGNSEGNLQGVEPWLKALAHALSKIKVNPPPHAWQALIGMGRDMSGGDLNSASESFNNAGMSAGPLDFEFEEMVPAKASLSSYRIERWQPFIVTGSSVGHGWQAADAAAREDLHLLCALLSVQTKRLWMLRQPPHPLAWGELPIPNGSATLKKVARTGPQCLPMTEPALNIEPQLQQLWQACMDDPECVDIARAYYEATQMSEHPSFALIGFVGVIEAVGAKLFRSSAQENCAACGKPKTNSAAKRFRDALSLVLSPDRVKAVSERLYKWRSGTAHAGRLHAMEASFGVPKISESMTVENLSLLFQARGPSHAQEIARDLLIHLLEKRPLKSEESDAQIISS